MKLIKGNNSFDIGQTVYFLLSNRVQNGKLLMYNKKYWNILYKTDAGKIRTKKLQTKDIYWGIYEKKGTRITSINS